MEAGSLPGRPGLVNFPRACFVAGTDTGVGKTLVTCALLEKLAAQGLAVTGLKPVAAGAEIIDGQPANADAAAIARACHPPASTPAEVNPVLLRAPLSPHIAARLEGRELAAASLAQEVMRRMDGPWQHCLVEGAGGWLAPINDRQTMADLALELGLPVILVVGLRLGCLSHALLTVESITRSGLPLYGWVASLVDPDMDAVAENHATLTARLPGQALGLIPWLADPGPASAAVHIHLNG